VSVTLNRPELLRALKLASQIAGNGKVVPMLANVLLRGNGAGRLTVSATDLRVSLSAELACTFGDAIGIVIDAKKLHELVANASADDISIGIESNGWATIKSGKVTFKIAGQPDGNFPSIPSHAGASFASVENAMLREMIARTMFAASDDESRPNMSGINLRSDGQRLTMTSTDGYRVCRLSRSMSIPVMNVIAPCLESVRNIIASAPVCQLALTREHLFVVQDATAISIKLIDLAAPLTDPIYAMSRPVTMTIGREQLLIAMKRCGVMTTEQTGAKMSLSLGAMRLSVVNPDLGEVHEDMEAEYMGEPMAIGFNPNFVVDILAQMSSDRVILEIAGPLDPALLRQVGNDDYAGIILPMRVS
jgi:DNA polymerase-3 subunit beta